MCIITWNITTIGCVWIAGEPVRCSFICPIQNICSTKTRFLSKDRNNSNISLVSSADIYCKVIFCRLTKYHKSQIPDRRSSQILSGIDFYSSVFAISMQRSINCCASTSDGAFVISSLAFCTFGNSTTSRKVGALSICITKRSSPIPIPP